MSSQMPLSSRMKVIGLAGWSGSGKPTLVVQLIPALVRRGVRVSTLNHANHAFDDDKPGSHSYAHRDARATDVVIGPGLRAALSPQRRAAPPQEGRRTVVQGDCATE